MISLDLEELDLTPMDYQELQESEGGWFWAVVGAGLLWDTISNPSAAAAAFSKGFNQWK